VGVAVAEAARRHATTAANKDTFRANVPMRANSRRNVATIVNAPVTSVANVRKQLAMVVRAMLSNAAFDRYDRPRQTTNINVEQSQQSTSIIRVTAMPS